MAAGLAASSGSPKRLRPGSPERKRYKSDERKQPGSPNQKRSGSPERKRSRSPERKHKRKPTHSLDQRGPGVTDDMTKTTRSNAQTAASELLHVSGLRSTTKEADVAFINHISQILVNSETKAELCAGPIALPANDLMRATCAAISRSAKNRLDPAAAATEITAPLGDLLDSPTMKASCKDKAGILSIIREDVRVRWKIMLQMENTCQNLWNKLANSDLTFTKSLDRVAARSWRKTVALAGIKLGAAYAAHRAGLIPLTLAYGHDLRRKAAETTKGLRDNLK